MPQIDEKKQDLTDKSFCLFPVDFLHAQVFVCSVCHCALFACVCVSASFFLPFDSLYSVRLLVQNSNAAQIIVRIHLYIECH